MGNRLFRVLANADRRRIISALLTGDGDIATVSDVTQEIAAQRDDHEQVRLRLYHHHLPKLEAAGIVDYDWRSGDIVLEEDAEDLRSLLDGDNEERGIPVSPDSSTLEGGTTVEWPPSGQGRSRDSDREGKPDTRP